MVGMARRVQEPTALYWTYIHNRAVDLGRQPSNTADLAVVRLACPLEQEANRNKGITTSSSWHCY